MPYGPTRRLQMHSCDGCRRRKIRCDSIDEAPCTACNRSGNDCSFTIGWRRRKRPRAIRMSSSSTSLPSDDVRQLEAGSDITAADDTPTPSTPEFTLPRSCISQKCRYVTNAELEAPKATMAVPESEVAISLDLAGNSLFRFFKDGIKSTSWQVFDHEGRIRVTYVGTDISNISHLVRLDQLSRSRLIYPYPPIHPPPPGKPDISHNQPGNNIQDPNCFLERGIRDDLVQSFFTKVHPYFPIVDEAGFRACYDDPEDQPPPPLLLHAVLLAGAHVSSHPKVAKARHMVKEALFRRAKQLFEARHENDRANLIQAALLFTWHLQNADTASANSYFWLGVACRIAFGIGMHRRLNDRPDPERMPICNQRMWRRIWWLLFQAEIMSALEHGRPSMIRFEDFDQEPLTRSDFEESNGVINTNVDFEFCSRNIELCHIALELVEMSAPRARVHNPESREASLDSRLVMWMLRVPSSYMDTFGGLILRLHYHTIVIHLCRLKMNSRPSVVISSPPEHANQVSYHEELLKIGGSAAIAIVSTLEALNMKSMLPQCHCLPATALMAAAIHISKGIQRSLENTSNTLLAVADLPLLERICTLAKKLSEYWPNTEGYRKVFQSLLEKFTSILSSIEEGTYQANAFTENELGGVNWMDVVGNSWHLEDSYSSEQGWEALPLSGL